MMGYVPPNPPPCFALVLRQRAVPLDSSDDAVLEAWCAEQTGRTLHEFCTTEYVRVSTRPPPPPAPPLPRAPIGGTAEILQSHNETLVPMPPSNRGIR